MKKVILKNISKKYGDKYIINNLSMEIEEGKIITITGKSGVGKTTLLNIIGQLDYEYDGELLIDNEIIYKNNKDQLMFFRNKIGFIFQNFALVENMTIKENLQMATKYSEKTTNDFKEVLAKVGLNVNVNKKVFTLSGGEQQRVAIARLLIKPCEIVLADEPTGSLDKDTKNEIIKLFFCLKELGKTVIIVTHDDDVVEIADYNFTL